MKVAIAWLLLIGVVVVCAGRTPDDDRAAPDVSLISIDWKYSGYVRSETVKENENIKTNQTSNGYSIARRSVYVFRYTAKAILKNVGAKAIKAISWDYVFVDGKDQKELKRYKFQSRQQILPGETQTLMRDIGLDPKESTQHISTGKQQVEIIRLEYADGSVWKR
ncbi:MAG: hypothetical protein QOJ64_4019 [Acidobacteriota bacterium]|jgi:hypothetical protein|nr:hypothetical protein [Acidobacteriota bacterium]